MPETKILTTLKAAYMEAKNKRSTWDSHYDEIQRYIRPDTNGFYEGRQSPLVGEKRNLDIYDGTAQWACEEFASGLHSMLTDSSSRWFQLGLQGLDTQSLSRESRIWLDGASDYLYHKFSLPMANLHPALHENYQDIGAFGTAVQYRWWDSRNGLTRFRPFPLSCCYIDEDSNGRVDKIYRSTAMSYRQIVQEWPEMEHNDTLKNAKSGVDDKFEVVHAVMPRGERDLKSWRAKDKKYASFFFSPDFGEDVLSEGGYDVFPYSAPRWTKIAGEVYGRSAGMRVLPDIKMVNQMAKELITGAQLSNHPPMIFENDSIIMAGAGSKKMSLSPKSILWKEAGTEKPEPLLSGSQPQLTLEMMQDRHKRITQAFYIDHLIRERKRERQSVTEILDERGEMMRQLSPQLGRLSSELLDDMIKDTIFYENRAGNLPPPPEELQGQELNISYINPAAKAQLGTQAQEIGAFIESLAPFGQVDPSVYQAIDKHELVRELAGARDLSPKIVKDIKRLKAEEEKAQQDQEMQQAAQAAPDVGRAVKDIAQARQVDPSII